MKNKSGAIELSVTTIIVVVIGITLLTLGLVWVQNIFKDLGEVSDNSFARAKQLIEGIEKIDKPLSIIPSPIEVEQNGEEVAIVVIANFEQETKVVTVGMVQPENDVLCGFFDVLSSNRKLKAEAPNNPYTLGSGERVEIAIAVKGNDADLGLTGCNVQLVGDIQQTKTLNVRVTPKSSGIFG
ncbi:MAG: hypothetical protein ABIH25_01995 [Candidatus Woesearchaeota archaeon]